MRRQTVSLLSLLCLLGIALVILFARPGGRAAPSQPVTPSGQNSTDTFRLDTPHANTTIVSPIKIVGAAQGEWYFEGELQVALLDQNGNTLAKGFVKARGDWSSGTITPFEGSLAFPPPATHRGFLVFKEMNQKTGAVDETFNLPVMFN